jgi:hypothetical protein
MTPAATVAATFLLVCMRFISWDKGLRLVPAPFRVLGGRESSRGDEASTVTAVAVSYVNAGPTALIHHSRRRT